MEDLPEALPSLAPQSVVPPRKGSRTVVRGSSEQGERTAGATSLPGGRGSIVRQVGGAAARPQAIQPSQTEPTPVVQEPEQSKKPAASLNRKVLEKTNRGKSSKSRSYVRGILHPDPVTVTLSAFFALLVRGVFVASVAILALVYFKVVPPVALWGLILFPITGIIYLIFMNKARCRVCGQKEFRPSRALKHVRSHSFLFFGPIISTALHVIFFRWFRCMFCGTSIRLKK